MISWLLAHSFALYRRIAATIGICRLCAVTSVNQSDTIDLASKGDAETPRVKEKINLGPTTLSNHRKVFSSRRRAQIQISPPAETRLTAYGTNEKSKNWNGRGINKE